MGRIINILGPHGVGKTTLQNYIRDNSLGIVVEGFILPTNGFDLNTPDGYLDYEKKYLTIINEQNKVIKNSDFDGYVIRSVEEVEYFLQTHLPTIDKNIIRKLIDDDTNIMCDLLIYLDASESVLMTRILGDVMRNQEETTEWYSYDYEKYDLFWKNFKKIKVIDTTNIGVEEVFKKISKFL